MDLIQQFNHERKQAIQEMGEDEQLKQMSLDWMLKADKYKYTYNYSWMGRPIIKFPNDIVVLQEIIMRVQPDYIIETGIAHGGSIIFSASMLELLGHGEVIAVDIDIREHNRVEIEKHPMFKRITMIEGSSTDPSIVMAIKEKVKGKKVLVCLDSLHTHAHVLQELKMYWDMVSIDSYIVCPDTFIEFFPKGYFKDRPWDVGNNTMTGLKEFLMHNDHFEIDQEINNKLLITEGFDGYLKRIK